LVFVLFLLIARASGPPDVYGEVLRALFLICPLALSTLAAIVLAILTAWRWRSFSRLQRWRGLLPLTLPVIIWSLSLAR